MTSTGISLFESATVFLEIDNSRCHFTSRIFRSTDIQTTVAARGKEKIHSMSNYQFESVDIEITKT